MNRYTPPPAAPMPPWIRVAFQASTSAPASSSARRTTVVSGVCASTCSCNSESICVPLPGAVGATRCPDPVAASQIAPVARAIKRSKAGADTRSVRMPEHGSPNSHRLSVTHASSAASR